MAGLYIDLRDPSPAARQMQTSQTWFKSRFDKKHLESLLVQYVVETPHLSSSAGRAPGS